MPTKVFEVTVHASPAEVWEFHASAKALDFLTPPDRKMRWVSTDLAVHEGAIHEFEVKLGPFWATWKAHLTEVLPPQGFRDTALKSPFKSWTHKREFLPLPKGTLIRDTIDYVPPFGWLGVLADRLFISNDIDCLFAYRHKAILASLGRD